MTRRQGSQVEWRFGTVRGMIGVIHRAEAQIAIPSLPQLFGAESLDKKRKDIAG